MHAGMACLSRPSLDTLQPLHGGVSEAWLREGVSFGGYFEVVLD